MTISFDSLGARHMLEFLQSISAGGWDDAALTQALSTQAYQRYLKFHSSPSWPDPFGETEFRLMLKSIAGQFGDGLDSRSASHMASSSPATFGPRLRKIQRGFSNALQGLGRLQEVLSLFETTDYQPTLCKVRSLLPPGTEIETTVYLLVDGFNNGTATDGAVLVDLLSMAPETWPSMPVVLGHELHHIGLDACLKHNATYLRVLNNLDQPARVAFRLLESLLSEGVANLHFSLHGTALEQYLMGILPHDQALDMARRWEEMRRAGAPKLEQFFVLILDLLKAVEVDESLISRRRALSQGLVNQPVPWVHVAGEAMIRAMETVHGREVTLRVISSPWELLKLYDSARIAYDGEPMPAVPKELLQSIDHLFA